MNSANLAGSSIPQFKSTEVRKLVEPVIDLGNLMLEDQDSVDFDPSVDIEINLRDLARENTQFLINKIWELPTSRVEDVIVAKLPKPVTRLPREKPLPRPKPETKWQKYAKIKGIENRKRGRKVWDEQTEQWKPRWGYDRANDNTKDWLIEIPDQVNPMTDYFEKRQQAKGERVAKNEMQRLRNIARSRNSSDAKDFYSSSTLGSNKPTAAAAPVNKKTTEQLAHQLVQARNATASIGKFTSALPNEKPPKDSGKRHQFAPNEGNVKGERDRQMEILKNLEKSKPLLNVEKAISFVSKQKRNDQQSGEKIINTASSGKKRGKGSKRKQQARKFNQQKFRNRKTKGKH